MKAVWALALLSIACVAVAQNELSDHPIVGDAQLYLDGVWEVSSPTAGIAPFPGRVPGDVISDLWSANEVPDPVWENNFKNISNFVAAHAWTYTTTFASPATAIAGAATGAGQQILLVFDGIKMNAVVSVNNASIGTANDQYLRFRYVLTPEMLVAPESGALNTLSVTFDAETDIELLGRFMACTGGWDWAPYTDTATVGTDAYPARTYSKGIWKSVYLVTVSTTAITHVVPHVFYTGAYPTAPLTPAETAPFQVHVRVHFWTPAPTTGTLTVSGEWGSSAIVPSVSLPAGETNVTVQLDAAQPHVKLWWPTGLRQFGEPNLYRVKVAWTPATTETAAATATATAAAAVDAPDAGVTLSTDRRIGFRFFALVTGNDTDPAYVAHNANADGTDRMGMRFRVNGAALYTRGANMIPMDELEGQYDAEALRRTVRAGVEANMNVLRVWGGGVFLPQVWYDTCDELGVLVYHDMQFAQEGHSPTQTPTQDSEFRHQIRRLSHHPSIVIWDGCNECQVIIGTPTGIYATFVLTVVAEEDASRVVWPSCPAPGWKNGVNRLTALPNGNTLVPRSNQDEMHVKLDAATAAATAADGLLAESFALMSTAGGGDGNGDACTFSDGWDVDNGGQNDPSYSSQSLSQCCAICTADPLCLAAVLDQWSTCWTKRRGLIFQNSGRRLCTPPGRTPLYVEFEQHGPYQHGSGFAAVNGDTSLDLFPSNVPLLLDATVPIGLEYPNVFVSEFGCSVFSSFESMSATLAPEHWSIHGGLPPDTCTGSWEKNCTGPNALSQRNYPCDSLILVYFGGQPNDFDAVGAFPFQQQTWQCMIGQSLVMQQQILDQRSQNKYGTIIWQLNEIWPTGGWGSIEYGSPNRKGSMLGGRWKPLHYLLRRSLFHDLVVACGNFTTASGNTEFGQCFVRNDAPWAVTPQVSVYAINFATSQVTNLAQFAPALAAGPGVVQWFTVPSTFDAHANLLIATAADPHAPAGRESVTVLPLVTPGEWIGIQNITLTTSVANQPNPDRSVTITVTNPGPGLAVYVTLTTAAEGRFSDNVFVLPGGSDVAVEFIPFDRHKRVDIGLLTSTLRVEHVGTYQSS